MRALGHGRAAWGRRLGSAALALLAALAGCSGDGDQTPKDRNAKSVAREDAAKERVVDLGGGVKIELVLIRPGSFDMGSEKGSDDEKPVHRVTIKKPFYMGKYEVTQEQWEAIMGDNPSRPPKNPREPVNCVTWDGCRNFVRKLSEKTRLAFALPSEAQWEYACRAGTTTEFFFGDDGARIGEYACYDGPPMVHPVGQKKPNGWGLFDIYGNVWEWCEDVGHATYDGAPNDGSAWMVGMEKEFSRVLRGGREFPSPPGCRSATRLMAPLGTIGDSYGCRVTLRDS